MRWKGVTYLITGLALAPSGENTNLSRAKQCPIPLVLVCNFYFLSCYFLGPSCHISLSKTFLGSKNTFTTRSAHSNSPFAIGHVKSPALSPSLTDISCTKRKAWFPNGKGKSSISLETYLAIKKQTNNSQES